MDTSVLAGCLGMKLGLICEPANAYPDLWQGTLLKSKQKYWISHYDARAISAAGTRGPIQVLYVNQG